MFVPSCQWAPEDWGAKNSCRSHQRRRMGVEGKKKKRQKEKTTTHRLTRRKKCHLLPSDTSSAKAARHCFESPHLTILGDPTPVYLRPNASKAQTTKVSDVSFSRLFFSPFHDMNFLKAPTFREPVLRASFLLKLQMCTEVV